MLLHVLSSSSRPPCRECCPCSTHNQQIYQLLAKLLLEQGIVGKDGAPTLSHPPQRVAEPEDLGHGYGDIKVIDFLFDLALGVGTMCRGIGRRGGQ